MAYVGLLSADNETVYEFRGVRACPESKDCLLRGFLVNCLRSTRVETVNDRDRPEIARRYICGRRSLTPKSDCVLRDSCCRHNRPLFVLPLATTMSATQTVSTAISQLTLQARDPSPSRDSGSSRLSQPLEPSGALDASSARRTHVTPAIGTEIDGIQVREILKAPNADDLIRDLALLGKFRPFFSSGKRGTALTALIISLPEGCRLLQKAGPFSV
jgi:hypothetical protein